MRIQPIFHSSQTNMDFTSLSFLVLLVFVSCKYCKGSSGACWAEEKTALLEIKASLSAPGGSWPLDWDDRVDCCGWERVSCDSITGRVVQLLLSETWPDSDSSNLLNSSLFLPFSELQHLDLSRNSIQACIPTSGFEMWSTLRKLEVLDLSVNHFSESINESLAGVSSLKTLLLSNNNIVNVLQIKDLSKLNLEILDLSLNKFVGTLPSLGNWPFLKALSLRGNGFNGTLSEDLCKMINLQELELSENGFTGVLPSCFQKLTSLEFLDLSQNQFQIKFPNSIFTNTNSLKYLSLSGNQMEGYLVLNTFSNHSQLKVLELSSQNNNFRVETESPMFNPSFQLEDLELSNCNLNNNDSIGVLPSFLLNQHNLSYLDLSHNKLRGSFPNWLIGNNVNIWNLNLRNNSITGPFVSSSQVNSKLSTLDLSNNKLIGKLPNDFHIKAPNLNILNLSRNSLEGPLPWTFSASINILDISYNNISDHIRNVFRGNLSYIESLFISNNRFYGSISSLEKVRSVINMALDNNLIIGEIPNNICNIIIPVNIDMSNNMLNGAIPSCLGKNPTLRILNLKNNSLEGSIKSVICNNNIQFLDLSQNNLSGPIPSCSNRVYFQYLHLHHNSFSGTFPISLANSPDLRTIDIRFNNFSGTIPNWIHKSFPMLRVLLLGGNQFEGIIPSQICQLKFLLTLDLSHNSLSGYIPLCLSNMGSQEGIFYLFEYATIPTLILTTSITKTGVRLPYYGSQFTYDYKTSYAITSIKADQEEFITKSRSDYYRGDILNYFSGIDLSFNLLEGYIPQEIGSMNWIRALNLSNNRLAGFIPKSLSNLTNLESLDLSHNYLTGQIPLELAKLNFLGSFSVAYNNLSGSILEKGQFNTFSVSSYEGNSYLCGPPLATICGNVSPALPNGERIGKTKNDDRLDLVILIGSFVVPFVLGFWGVVAVIYYKRNWNRAIFLAVDKYTNLLVVKIILLTRRVRNVQA